VRYRTLRLALGLGGVVVPRTSRQVVTRVESLLSVFVGTTGPRAPTSRQPWGADRVPGWSPTSSSEVTNGLSRLLALLAAAAALWNAAVNSSRPRRPGRGPPPPRAASGVWVVAWGGAGEEATPMPPQGAGSLLCEALLRAGEGAATPLRAAAEAALVVLDA
jgi:hypothetical protein